MFYIKSLAFDLSLDKTNKIKDIMKIRC